MNLRLIALQVPRQLKPISVCMISLFGFSLTSYFYGNSLLYLTFYLGLTRVSSALSVSANPYPKPGCQLPDFMKPIQVSAQGLVFTAMAVEALVQLFRPGRLRLISVTQQWVCLTPALRTQVVLQL